MYSLLKISNHAFLLLLQFLFLVVGLACQEEQLSNYATVMVVAVDVEVDVELVEDVEVADVRMPQLMV